MEFPTCKATCRWRAWITHYGSTGKPNAETWPRVWIVKAEDQPRARQLMRDAGIQPAVRHAQELASWRRGTAAPASGYRRWSTYIRLGLLAAIAAIILLRLFS